LKMTDRAIETSPQTYAKIGGYLIIIAIGLFGEAFVRGKVIVSADAAATAAKSQDDGVTGALPYRCRTSLVDLRGYRAMDPFFLPRPVSRDLAILAVFFNLVSIGIEAVSTMYLIAAFPLGDAGYLKAFRQRTSNSSD
jgi:hypothetical protein